jgi:hypothetical protein
MYFWKYWFRFLDMTQHGLQSHQQELQLPDARPRWSRRWTADVGQASAPDGRSL